MNYVWLLVWAGCTWGAPNHVVTLPSVEICERLGEQLGGPDSWECRRGEAETTHATPEQEDDCNRRYAGGPY